MTRHKIHRQANYAQQQGVTEVKGRNLNGKEQRNIIN
jgi:hypothetical protein